VPALGVTIGGDADLRFTVFAAAMALWGDVGIARSGAAVLVAGREISASHQRAACDHFQAGLKSVRYLPKKPHEDAAR
jgi:hypothetical protein